MSSSPRQYWQEDNKGYTFNQYAFYLIVLGIVIAGLLIGYFILMRGPDIPVTHLVSIISQPGGELPVIPFQNEDSTALKTSFENYAGYEFNDIASFEQDVIKKLRSDCDQQNQDIDTVIIWLSAIGHVQDGKPVILGSDPGQQISLESLVDQLGELKAQNVVLLLDCGHAYVAPDAYVNQSVESDFNPFPGVAIDAFGDLPADGKVQVLVNGVRGERPMYSTTRRRSLFGQAIESSFKQDDETFWSTEKLATDLDEFCLSQGGTAAPHLKWLGKDPGEIEFRRPIVIGTEEEIDPEEKPDPDKIEISADASKIASEMNKSWSAYQRTRDKFAVPPTTIDPDNWRLITRRLIGFTADELQSDIALQDFTNSCNKIRLDLQDLEELLRDKTERVLGNLNLIPDPNVESESRLVLEKRHVANAVIRIHDLEQRLPHYVAIVDSLSWIFPTNDAVEQLATNTSQLIELFGETNQETDFSSVLQKSDPSLDQLDGINIASDRIFRSEERLLKKLNYVCRYVVKDTPGFQREMAVEALLRMPFLEAEKPDPTTPGFENEDRLWSREELQETLATNPINPFPRIELSDREIASAKRIEIFRKFIANVASPGNPNPTSLRLQSFAYRLSAANFDINNFVVRDRTPEIWVKANRRDDLENGENYIELAPTELDLGLDVKHTEVLVQCEIIQSEKYFAFAGGDNGTSKFVFTGNPKLVALRDSLDTDPQCKLNISIVDKTNVSKEYDNFTIPIRLPSKNRIELIVDVGGLETVFKKDSLGDPIRPFANRKDLCTFSLRNNWHRPRTGTISLYACERPVSATIVGKIDNEVKQQTLRALEVSSLPIIATAMFELPGAVTGQAINPVKLVWQNPPDVKENPGIAVDHGFLCVVNHEDAGGEGWHYWIPVFPFEKPVVSILPNVMADDLTLFVKRKEFCPAEMSVSLRWRFTGDQINGGGEILGVGKNTLEIPVARNVSQVLNKNGSFLYVDVDDWPRKYVFEFNGRTFNPVAPNDAAVSVRIGKKADAPPKVPVLIELPSAGDIVKYGTSSDDDTVTVKLAVNVPYDSDAFLFSRAEDHISLFETGGANQNLYYPRQISNTVQLAPKSGIMLESRVSDYELTFEEVGPRFQLSPTLHLAQRELSLRGQNQIQIQFDKQAPKISDVRVATSSPIYGKQPVRIRVEATDGEGVGIDWNKNVEIFLSERNGSLKNLSGKPRPSKRVDATTFEIEAPEEIGHYTVGAMVADLVGNEDEFLGANRVKFEVVTRPVVVKKKPVIIKPKIFTHTLIVTVQADDLSNVTDPEVEIKPPDASPEIQNGKYIFKELKGGVQYKVTAKAKIKRGVAKGDELSATLLYKFPKDAEDTLTAPRSMKLKR